MSDKHQNLNLVGAAPAKVWACRSRQFLLAAPLSLAPALACAATLGGNHSNLWNFSAGIDGASPRGDLLLDSSDNLYGTTSVGGTSGCGGVFEATPSKSGLGLGSILPLYDFTCGADGGVPMAGLIADASGALYGTTAMDGAAKAGTVFKLSPPSGGGTVWTETTLWNFGVGQDGRNPTGTLTAGASGALYGTTSWGGASNQGTVFVLTPNASTNTYTETVIWSFTGGGDGSNPVAALIQDSGGALYGTTKAGGPAGVGTVFQLTSPAAGQTGWSETTVHGFTGGTDGGSPTGTLLPDGTGGFYGATEFGGVDNAACEQALFPYYGEPDIQASYAAEASYVPAGGNRCGLIFHIVPPANAGGAWPEALVWQFTGKLDGANPVAGLAPAYDGSLYGVSTQYGQTYWGTEYKLTPPTGNTTAWALTPIAVFNGKSEGFYPRSTPTIGKHGVIYGTTIVGGKYWTHVTNYGYGSIFTSIP